MPRKTTKTLDKLRSNKIVHDDKVCTTNKYYDDETLQQILDVIKSLKKTKPEMYFFYMILVYTGARRSEVCLVKRGDLQNGYVTMDSNKGGNRRSVPLPKRFYKEVFEWSRDKDWLFKHTPWWYSRFMRKLIPPSKNDVKMPLHAIRHSMAMRLLKRTGNIFLVKLFLGHKSLTSTLIYIDALETKDFEKDLKEIFKQQLDKIE